MGSGVDAAIATVQGGRDRFDNPPRHAPAHDDDAPGQLVRLDMQSDDLGALLAPVDDGEVRICPVEYRIAHRIGKRERGKALLMQPVGEEIARPSAGMAIGDARQDAAPRYEHDEARARPPRLEPD